MTRCTHMTWYGKDSYQCKHKATQDNNTKCGFHSKARMARMAKKKGQTERRRKLKEAQDKERKVLQKLAVAMAKFNDKFAADWEKMEKMTDAD